MYTDAVIINNPKSITIIMNRITIKAHTLQEQRARVQMWMHPVTVISPDACRRTHSPITLKQSAVMDQYRSATPS